MKSNLNGIDWFFFSLNINLPIIKSSMRDNFPFNHTRDYFSFANSSKKSNTKRENAYTLEFELKIHARALRFLIK